MSLSSNESVIYQSALKQASQLSLNLLAVKVTKHPVDFNGWCRELIDVCRHRINRDLLDVEQLGRSPKVYKPTLVSDWTKPGRHLISVSQGMMEWPSLGLSEALRWLSRSVRSARRSRGLRRRLRVANTTGR